MDSSMIKRMLSEYYVDYDYMQVDYDTGSIKATRKKEVKKRFKIFPVYENFEETIEFTKVFEISYIFSSSCESEIAIAVDKLDKIIYWKLLK